jgi:hypothetical protein
MKHTKTDIFLLTGWLMLLLFTCQPVLGQGQETPKPKTAVIDKTETCRSNPKHTYQVFVPSVEQGDNQLSMLVLIDPHGDGKLAVNGFKDVAQKYQTVVIGSNLIKNNDPNFIKELEELIADVKNRYPVGNILFVGGFSGGARMGLAYATGHPVKGVLACGALAQKEEINSISCKIMCLIGMEDFNFIEAAPFVLDPLSMPSNLAIEITKTSHDWQKKEQLAEAFRYLLLLVMPPGIPAEKKKYIKDFVAEQKQRIETAEKAGEHLQACLISKNMMGNPYFERETNFMDLTDELAEKTGFRNQAAELNKNFQFEAKLRDAYLNALVKNDSAWWNNEIKTLNSKIAEEKNEFSLQTYKRIKGFLGIACYSLSSRFAEEKDAPKLEQVLVVYRMVEPSNSAIPQLLKTLAQLKKEGKK